MKYWAMLLLVILVVFNISSVISSSVNSITIGNNGRISIPNVTAKSGSAKDIQDAVNWVAANGGVGNVHIPEGTFNFVNVGEPWTTVSILAGVNVFGALTDRDANGQVIMWKTVLVMPWDVPGNDTVGVPIWFQITGNKDPNKPSRFSDIKLVGYRDIDPTSKSLHYALSIHNVLDWRVDHCYFRHTCNGMIVYGTSFRGVIDHCKFINQYGVPYGPPSNDFQDHTIGYGVAAYRETTAWETDISKVLGQYTDYTVFIEDCTFTRWRHCIALNVGAHFVFRHSIITGDFGMGSLDGHGADTPSVGTRAIEAYENVFSAPNYELVMSPTVLWYRAGSGAVFNNTITGYAQLAELSREGTATISYPNDLWFWNNTGVTSVVPYDGITEGVQYHLDAPLIANGDPFNYTPYQYPHPLTLRATP